MKSSLKVITLLISISLFHSCGNLPAEDETPPAPPKGVRVINGDKKAEITWRRNSENDVAGYNVYYSYSYDGKYTLIGSTTSNSFIDAGIRNGIKYYYAVTAYDYNDNESDLSEDVVYAVPRPEGFNQSIFDFRRFPNSSGYSFSKYSVVKYDSDDADFFFENYQGTYYLVVYDDTDIIDMGPTVDIYDIQFAPDSGWSPTKDEIAKVGHTYVIWTWNNHFAKIRVKNITPERIVFDWAYQTVKGERMLKSIKERKLVSKRKFYMLSDKN
ncbi:MAG: hypothetical protein NZM09_08790 [Ignavibacterium sp.]|nr:hypothetical protein [Ignavibacterium sp.]MDW8375780.1 hypothetical protein [Ignavibacteriales bacterium]